MKQKTAGRDKLLGRKNKQNLITGSVLLIIFRSMISLCFITCLIRISFNLKKDQKNLPHDPQHFFAFAAPKFGNLKNNS